MDMAKEHISLILDLIAVFLSFQMAFTSYSFATAAEV